MCWPLDARLPVDLLVDGVLGSSSGRPLQMTGDEVPVAPSFAYSPTLYCFLSIASWRRVKTISCKQRFEAENFRFVGVGLVPSAGAAAAVSFLKSTRR